MNVNFTDRGPCQMKPGDIRRIPRDRNRKLVSYQICCPECGFVVTVFEDASLKVLETDDMVSFSSQIACPFCHVSIRLNKNAAIVTREPTASSFR